MNKITFRMDDVGASTKLYNIYSKKFFGNFFFLKKMSQFKAWGPYNEIEPNKWEEIFDYIGENNFKLTLAITASWVDEKSNLIPFYDKFPKQAKIISENLKHKFLEITNHGLTHCVVGKHLPRLMSSSRKYHREFWDWLPYDLHYSNLDQSSTIFKNWLGYSPRILVPPGNVYSLKTINACEKLNFDMINSSTVIHNNSKIRIYNNDNVFAFHDRDIVLNGVEWLKQKYNERSFGYEFKFLKEIK
jgi:hypothetical protein